MSSALMPGKLRTSQELLRWFSKLLFDIITILLATLLFTIIILCLSSEFKISNYLTTSLFFILLLFYIVIFKYINGSRLRVWRIGYALGSAVLLYYCYFEAIILYSRVVILTNARCTAEICELFTDETVPGLEGTSTEFTLLGTDASFVGKEGEEEIAKLSSRYPHIDQVIRIDTKHIAIIRING